MAWSAVRHPALSPATANKLQTKQADGYRLGSHLSKRRRHPLATAMKLGTSRRIEEPLRDLSATVKTVSSKLDQAIRRSLALLAQRVAAKIACAAFFFEMPFGHLGPRHESHAVREFFPSTRMREPFSDIVLSNLRSVGSEALGMTLCIAGAFQTQDATAKTDDQSYKELYRRSCTVIISRIFPPRSPASKSIWVSTTTMLLLASLDELRLR